MAQALSLQTQATESNLGHGFCCLNDESSAMRHREAIAFLEPLSAILSQRKPGLTLEPLATQGDGFCLFYVVAASCKLEATQKAARSIYACALETALEDFANLD